MPYVNIAGQFIFSVSHLGGILTSAGGHASACSYLDCIPLIGVYPSVPALLYIVVATSVALFLIMLMIGGYFFLQGEQSGQPDPNAEKKNNVPVIIIIFVISLVFIYLSYVFVAKFLDNTVGSPVDATPPSVTQTSTPS